jgi:hypothetical protein
MSDSISYKSSGYAVTCYKPYGTSVTGYAWAVRDIRGVPMRQGMAATKKEARAAGTAAHRDLLAGG